jgi:rhodanese-related sulfurtransferase
MRMPRLHRSAPIVGTLAFLAVAWSCVRGDATSRASIEPSELAARISSDEAPFVLDVRSPDEFASGHIPGAVNVPVHELAERLLGLGLSPSDEIVVHCERGGRAEAAESILRESGYTGVRDLGGHMQAWRAGGHPLE